MKLHRNHWMHTFSALRIGPKIRVLIIVPTPKLWFLVPIQSFLNVFSIWSFGIFQKPVMSLSGYLFTYMYLPAACNAFHYCKVFPSYKHHEYMMLLKNERWNAPKTLVFTNISWTLLLNYCMHKLVQVHNQSIKSKTVFMS